MGQKSQRLPLCADESVLMDGCYLSAATFRIQFHEACWWEEVILLYAGQNSDASPLLLSLLGEAEQDRCQDDLFHTNLILAGRCLAASPLVRLASLREVAMTRLFELLTSTQYSLTQKQCVEALLNSNTRS